MWNDKINRIASIMKNMNITKEEFQRYIAEGVIQGGMIPKLENSFEAINAGVSEVVITLASAIHTDGGTRIKK